MKRVLPILIVIVTVVLVAMGTVRTNELSPAKSPEGAVQSLFAHVKAHDYEGAYAYVANASNSDEPAFARDLSGRDGSLRTYSSLQQADTKVLHQNDNEALVRATLEYATAVGAFYDTRDLKVVKEGDSWKVEWPLEKEAKVPPQVIQENYLRWDVITRGSSDDWGAQNVEAPRVRIVSMNAIPQGNNTIIVGEIENEDTVPGFVSVNATLTGKDGNTLGEESSFDKISHTLLPKEISPFRIDFPKVPLSKVKERPHAAEFHAGAGFSRPGDWRHASASRDRRARPSCVERRAGKPERGNREHPTCSGYLLRQCRQSDLGFRWLCGPGTVAADSGALCGGPARRPRVERAQLSRNR